MNGDHSLALIYALGGLVLVGSALAARQLPLARTVKMALAWIGIFAAVYVLFLFRSEGQEVWRRITADISGDRAVQSGNTLRIPKSDDGHFYVTGLVNGHKVEFLIDSGATVTTLAPEIAHAAEVQSDGGPPIFVDTANGTARSQPARAAKFAIGAIEHSDERVNISEMTESENLLGMSFLSSLRSWRVDGNTLIIEP